MAQFLKSIPIPISVEKNVPNDLGTFNVVVPSSSKTIVPPYGRRGKWVPRRKQDFGGGGAYPEIHVIQYPIIHDILNANKGKIVPLITATDGSVQYDAIIKQGADSDRIYHTAPAAQKPKAPWTVGSITRQSTEEEVQNVERTKAAIEARLQEKAEVGAIAVPKAPETKFIRYTPSNATTNQNSSASQRIIRLVDAPVDLLEPSKFRHRKVPPGPRSPPPPIQHSPPRKLTLKDQQDWKIPPCVSNWKNQKGYTIPLDKRLQADGRLLKEVSVNDKFASLSESLYIAERSAREEIRLRNELLKQKKIREEEEREEQLKRMAAKSRKERVNLQMSQLESVPGATEQIHEEITRKHEINRDMRREQALRKRTRHADERDISERVALGQAKPSAQDSLFDSRLFNQSSGITAGFDHDDEDYAIYDKALFSDRSSAGIYKFESERMKRSIGDKETLPAFSNADASATRSAPVQFEKHESDPFGLDSLLKEAKNK